MQVKYAKTIEEIKSLENPWNELIKESGQKTMFASFDWVVSWFECNKNSKPFILTAWNKEKLSGIATLCLEENRLCFAAQTYSANLDFVARKGLEQEASKAIAKEIFKNRKWKTIRFLHLANNPIFVEAMEKEAKKDSFVVRKSMGEPTNVISLLGTENDFFASLKRTKRKHLRNQLNKFGKTLNVETKFWEKEEFEKAWDKFFELHGKNMDLRQTKSILQEPWFQCFYKKAAEKALGKKRLWLMGLIIDGKEAAILYGIVFGKTFNALNMGFDAKLAKGHSLGKILLLKAIKPCCEKGIKTYDLLPGSPKYKSMIGTRKKGGMQFEVFGTPAEALVHSIKVKAKGTGKKILGRI